MGPQGGRRPFPLPSMLRIYCLQQWYNLSDPGAEEALYDIQSMRAFAGLELGRDSIPDETTILNFRHLLERHDLTKAIFEAVAEHLAAKGELLAIDLETGKPAHALVERSDVSAVEALAVVAEAAVAWELARAAREKFGGDAVGDLVAAHRAYLERISWTPPR